MSIFNLRNAFVAAQGLSALAQGYSAYAGYKSQKKEASLVRQRAEVEAGQKRRETQRTLARIRSQYSTAGISLEGSETASAILNEQDKVGEEDAAAILNMGYSQAKALRSGATGSLIGGGLSVGSSLFGGYVDYKIADKKGWFNG